jgi:hypothetical protein
MSSSGNPHNERGFVVHSRIPAWAGLDWDETVERFLQLLPALPDDVKKAYDLVTVCPADKTAGDFADVLDGVMPVLFHPQRLAELLSDFNPRVLSLRKQRAIGWQQVQFYVLRLFREAAARIAWNTSQWLPSIPDGKPAKKS